MTFKNFKAVALQLIADWNRDDMNRHSKPSPTLEVLEARALALINVLQSQKEKCPMRFNKIDLLSVGHNLRAAKEEPHLIACRYTAGWTWGRSWLAGHFKGARFVAISLTA